MATQRHRIRREVLVLTASTPEAARRAQSQIRRIHSPRILPLLERACSAASSPDRIHRIDSLELDLGRLDPGDLERGFLEKLDARLRAALPARIGSDELREGDRVETPGAASSLELVAFFARTGNLPWWADTKEPRLLAESLRRLLGDAPGALARLVRELAREPRPLRRLAMLLDDEMLAQIARVLAPLSAPTGGREPRELAALLQIGALPAGTTAARARSVVWLGLLHAASAGPTGPASPVELWREALLRMALETRLAYADLLSVLKRELRRRGDPESGTAAIIDRLHRELPGAYGAESDLPTATVDGARPAVGTAGADGEGGSTAALLPEIVAVLDRLRRDAGPLAELFTALRAAAARLPSDLRPAWLASLRAVERQGPGRALLGLVEPAVRHRLLPATALVRILDELRGAAGTALPVAPARELTRLLEAARLAEPPRESPRETPLDLTFSDSEVAYVENSGLVLLTPFLGRFFERLELVKENRFNSPEAAQRAVGLLQYLAAGDPAPPEYLLTLNKVLCGVEVEEVFDFGSPILQAEAEECGYLLTAVIDHATILRKMSIDGFRGSFLIRRGVLSAGEGFWLLRVERESWDVVMDRFPWSVSWVRLPWMEAPLRVEW